MQFLRKRGPLGPSLAAETLGERIARGGSVAFIFVR
jgi:hypothetical protein